MKKLIKISNDFEKLLVYNFLYNFRSILVGDLVSIYLYSYSAAAYYGLCIAKYNKNVSSTIYLRNVHNLYFIMEKIFPICSFIFNIVILRKKLELLLLKNKNKLFYYRNKSRKISKFVF
jgi:ribosomal protein L19